MSEGKIKFEVTIDEGFDNLPSAFRKLFTGENFGKQVVKVVEEEKTMKNIIVRFIFSLLFYKSGVSHFKNKDMFLKIVPSYLPFKHAIVKCSGILEFIIVFMYSVLKIDHA